MFGGSQIIDRHTMKTQENTMVAVNKKHGNVMRSYRIAKESNHLLEFPLNRHADDHEGLWPST